ncbi:DNA repair protein REV1 [Gracilariopsis chorda]|uniref:DNA polymerase kappa n=1 Tax=Gracilariopsis chorda TaxID=448386 RepID=A0A2V3IYY6_9FLOR|nr:DNA repair protein REV1 [Gracilariopsis chorda]|eukprot:PXF47354.1 DNA repair protein REV1 [Gracilariopsis chorda]
MQPDHRQLSASNRAHLPQPTQPNSFWNDPRPSNRNPNFVRDYFQSSRLHFIGSFRARYEAMMVAVAKRLKVNPGSLISAAPTSSCAERLIVHIDMDCFFASVAVKRDPSLRAKCIAVCHGGGEISSCSYEARKFGVRAGMFAKDARKLCPNLLSVPYHFPTYEQISIQIYALFHDYPGVFVEAVSVDEAYLDITDTAKDATSQAGADDLVQSIRSRIVRETGCTASAGIGPSKLIARLATKAAKPNGQLRVRPENVIEYIDTLKVSDLPGVGWSTSKKMTQIGIETIPQLRRKSLSFLQTNFGERQGQTLHDLARAIDSRPVEPLKPRKSIGAEASWGIRFEENEDDKLSNFISDMASEVASRVESVGASGSKVCVKLYRRKPNSSMLGYKFLGHGPCTILSRMYNIPRPCDWATLRKALCDSCLRVIKETRIRNDEFRGLGLQVVDLKFGELRFDHSGAPVKGVKRIDSFFNVSNRRAPASQATHGQLRKTSPPNDVDTASKAKGSSDRDEVLLEKEDEITPKEDVRKQKKNVSVNDKDTEIEKRHDKAQPEEDGVEIVADNRIPNNGADKLPDNHGLTSKIPFGWDTAVFKALPESLQAELLQNNRNQTTTSRANTRRATRDETKSAAPTRGASKKRASSRTRQRNVARRPRRRQRAQITMTQFADIRELRDKGNDVLDAEEFRCRPLKECVELLQDLNHGRRNSAFVNRQRRSGVPTEKRKSVSFAEANSNRLAAVEETLEIPSPPCMSSDYDSDENNRMLHVVEKAGVEHTQIYATEDVTDFSDKLYSWMRRTAVDVKSGHVELVRGRLMECIRLKQLDEVCENVRLLHRFAEGDGLEGWRVGVNALLREIGEETRRQHGLDLKLPPLFPSASV